MTNSAGNRGLTFLEVIIAGFVLTVCIVPLFALFQTSLGRVKISRPELVAGILAGEVMDQMRLVPYASLPMGTSTTIAIDAGQPPVGRFIDPEGKIPLLLGTYPASLKLEIATAPISRQLAGVRVVVTFDKAPPGQPPSPEKFELTEYVADRLARGDAP
jgi:hypothetical protein